MPRNSVRVNATTGTTRKHDTKSSGSLARRILYKYGFCCQQLLQIKHIALPLQSHIRCNLPNSRGVDAVGSRSLAQHRHAPSRDPYST